MTSHFDFQPEYRRNLPHIQPEGATFFITARLAGSLPWAVIERLQEERRLRRQAIERMDCPQAEKWAMLYEEDRRYFGRYDRLLDGATDSAGCGAARQMTDAAPQQLFPGKHYVKLGK